MCPVNSQNDEKHTLNDRARDGSHGHGLPFLEINALLLMCPDPMLMYANVVLVNYFARVSYHNLSIPRQWYPLETS